MSSVECRIPPSVLYLQATLRRYESRHAILVLQAAPYLHPQATLPRYESWRAALKGGEFSGHNKAQAQSRRKPVPQGSGTSRFSPHHGIREPERHVLADRLPALPPEI